MNNLGIIIRAADIVGLTTGLKKEVINLQICICYIVLMMSFAKYIESYYLKIVKMADSTVITQINLIPIYNLCQQFLLQLLNSF